MEDYEDDFETDPEYEDDFEIVRLPPRADVPAVEEDVGRRTEEHATTPTAVGGSERPAPRVHPDEPSPLAATDANDDDGRLAVPLNAILARIQGRRLGARREASQGSGARTLPRRLIPAIRSYGQKSSAPARRHTESDPPCVPRAFVDKLRIEDLTSAMRHFEATIPTRQVHEAGDASGEAPPVPDRCLRAALRVVRRKAQSPFPRERAAVLYDPILLIAELAQEQRRIAALF